MLPVIKYLTGYTSRFQTTHDYIIFLRKSYILKETGLSEINTTKSCKLVDLHTLYNNPKFLKWLEGSNIYLSTAIYKHHVAATVNIATVNELYVDIDYHSQGLSTDGAQEVIATLNQHVFNKELLPKPSMIVASGQGLHLRWFIEPCADGYYCKLMMRAIQTILRPFFLAHLSDATLDPATTPGRYLRVPFTLNTFSNTPAQILYETNHIYMVTDINRIYFNNSIYSDTQKPKTKTESKKVKVTASIQKAKNNANRLKDLELLQHIRATHQWDNFKELACYTYMQHALLLHKGDFDVALQQAVAYNSNFEHPVASTKLINKLQSCKTWYKHNNNQVPSNIALIERLNITQLEESQLNYIKYQKQSRDVKNAKLRAKLRNKNGLTKTQQAKYNQITQVHKLIKEGKTTTDIARVLNVSARTVQRYVSVTPENFFIDCQAKADKGRN